MTIAMETAPGLSAALRWFDAMGRTPFAFQRAAWEAYARGESGLILAPTGMGKTLAAGLGPAIEFLDSQPQLKKKPRQSRGLTEEGTKRRFSKTSPAPLTLVWITPLRALAGDTVHSLQFMIDGLHLPWSVQLRTSDTTASVRKKQRDRLPTILVTTPESLSVLMSYPESNARWQSLRAVVVDEWHELLSSKRGVQVELGLARLRSLAPQLRTWGLSATIANLDDAATALLGPAAAKRARIITAPDDKPIELATLLPAQITRFPWAGHLGASGVPQVVERIEKAGSTLVFTNTRSQSELWFAALMRARPDWLGKIALHHGSLDQKLRRSVEQMLRDGQLKAVVCTSSLDLGVDFWPVDSVIQIGSPKSVARAMQRAGRSGHRPGAVSRLTCVPTQAFELIEFSAARHAIERRAVESRFPVHRALDVLAQHVVTLAAGDGFDGDALLAEVRSTSAFADITDQHWQWVLDFAERGGPTLWAYPQFSRITKQDGRWTIASPQIAKMHRMNIGTIAADGAVAVQFVGGKRLGSVEESFIAKLNPGDTFAFAGRVMELVRVHEMTALVRKSKRKSAAVPRWMGGRFPLSASLADAVRHRLDEAAEGIYADVEMETVAPILQLQAQWSRIPRTGQLLIEAIQTRDGFHYFLFPFQGRLVHEGLAALLTYRIGVFLGEPQPILASFNDYGLELMAMKPLDIRPADWPKLLTGERLLEDILACLNSGELAKRHFREIARIAGLLVPTRPGAHRSLRQLQASSGLFYDVFREFDPENLLLDQARREVLERSLETTRMREALDRIAREHLTWIEPAKMSPLAFPLFAERIGSQQLRLESAAARIERLAAQLEKDAGEESAPAKVIEVY